MAGLPQVFGSKNCATPLTKRKTHSYFVWNSITIKWHKMWWPLNQIPTSSAYFPTSTLQIYMYERISKTKQKTIKWNYRVHLWYGTHIDDGEAIFRFIAKEVMKIGHIADTEKRAAWQVFVLCSERFCHVLIISEVFFFSTSAFSMTSRSSLLLPPHVYVPPE